MNIAQTILHLPSVSFKNTLVTAQLHADTMFSAKQCREMHYVFSDGSKLVHDTAQGLLIVLSN